jgi:hypothetical protein
MRHHPVHNQEQTRNLKDGTLTALTIQGLQMIGATFFKI